MLGSRNLAVARSRREDAIHGVSEACTGFLLSLEMTRMQRCTLPKMSRDVRKRRLSRRCLCRLRRSMRKLQLVVLALTVLTASPKSLYVLCVAAGAWQDVHLLLLLLRLLVLPLLGRPAVVGIMVEEVQLLREWFWHLGVA